jgi:DNA-binding PadR family transcriptional regulator
MRTTREMRKLASVLLKGAADSRFYSWDLRQAADVHNARLYPLLTLLLDRGWITDGYDPSPADESNDDQPQHWYALTDLGRHELSKT